MRAIWEHSWPSELTQGGQLEALVDHALTYSQAEHALGQQVCFVPVVPDNPAEIRMLDPSASALEAPGYVINRLPGMPPLVLLTLAQAIEAYLQAIKEMDRGLKTVQWHRTVLAALQRYVWE